MRHSAEVWAVYESGPDALPFLTLEESEARTWQRLGYAIARYRLVALPVPRRRTLILEQRPPARDSSAAELAPPTYSSSRR